MVDIIQVYILHPVIQLNSLHCEEVKKEILAAMPL